MIRLIAYCVDEKAAFFIDPSGTLYSQVRSANPVEVDEEKLARARKHFDYTDCYKMMGGPGQLGDWLRTVSGYQAL